MENLNQKIWYRAIKVLFILLFLVVQIFSYIIVSSSFSEKVEIVKCDNGKEFESPYPFDIFTVQKVCTGSSFIPKTEPEPYSDDLINEIRKNAGSRWEKYYSFGGEYGLLSFITFEKDRYTLIKKVSCVGLSIIVISFIFWLISRIFFYVVLGEGFIKKYKIK